MTEVLADKMAVDLAVVVIGRNEGDRLVRCLQSVDAPGRPVVYVDSGSTDGSVDIAKSLGAVVIELDLQSPFTAARARNTGFSYVAEKWPELRFIQFVDGDCEVEEHWLVEARRLLEERSDVAVAFGRRRERYPERSIFNRLCDIEWEVPAGEARSCGGDAMMRTVALREVGGYREDLVAGEEPELCVRLRRSGWKIYSTGLPMTIHDAAMTRVSQWWNRSVRCGWAFAAGSHLHGSPPERHFVREARRGWLWAAGIPVATALALIAAGPAGLGLLLIYPAQVIRLWQARRLRHRYAASEALFQVAGKFPELVGQIRFYREMMFGRERRLIEYK